MLSLVHMMRENTDKLERHEARNRQSDEQLKKNIALLTKRMSTIDGLKAYLVKLDERVAGIEQLIAQVIPTLSYFQYQLSRSNTIQQQQQQRRRVI